jgi:DNA-binding transcriptional ArsR family regulator
MQPTAEPIALDMSDVLHAMSDPARRQIVAQLDRDGECQCGGFGLTVTKSTATYHFRVLREAGVIEQRSDGNRKLNTLRRDALDARFPGLLDAMLAG